MLTRNKISICLTFIIIIIFSGSLHAFDLEKKVIKTKLTNGLTVLMLDRKFSPTVSLYIRYRVGAVDEVEGQSGAAHFLEHMMFKGTTTIGTKNYAEEKKILAIIEKTGMKLDQEKKEKNADPKIIKRLSVTLKALQEKHRRYYIPNEIDRLYTENGGMHMNATTGQDVTTYYVSLPANKIELWARIESDRLMHPVFREFYTERDVILEERRQRVETNPDGKLYETFIHTAYTIHPYGRPILGWPEDIKFMTPQALRNIHKKYLTPSNIVIAVVGDIDPPRTLKLIDRYFGGLPMRSSTPHRIFIEPEQTKERVVNISYDANPRLMIGYHKPTAPSFEDYVFDVLEKILSDGRTSRLYSKLVLEKQIADSIHAHNGIPGSRYPNMFVIFATPRHPNTIEDLQKAIDQELSDILSQSVSSEELDKAKKKIKMDFITSLDSNSELASILSHTELLLGDYRYFANYLPQIERVTPADIQNIAAKYLTKHKRTIATLTMNKDVKNDDHAK
jgi:predicted Zn-dependent peptidase